MSGDDVDAGDIARMLNNAHQMGFGGTDIADVLQDYFTDPAPDSDDTPDESDDDVAPAEAFEPDDDLSAESEPEQETEAEAPDISVGAVDEVAIKVKAAATLAENELDFVAVPDRKNHCRCQLFSGDRCINQFTENEQNEIRMKMRELSPFEKDLILLGMICMSLNDSATTEKSKKKAGSQTVRTNTRIRSFFVGHKRICRDTFFFLMETCKNVLTRLKKHYEQKGLMPTEKHAGGRSNIKHALKSLKTSKQWLGFY
ncbi:uncharacterized protein LOC135489401 [Lineus longissimus]|uniref:uncharacterized protein LOC135489401 n=1 Tax=Lineus longissimus TaxID=88925 RepID=UPI00315D728B